MAQEPTLVTLEPATTAVISARVTMAGIRDVFDTGFGALAAALGAQGIAPTGAAFARYHGDLAATFDVEIGFATATPVATDGDVHAATLPGGRVAQAVHVGGYDGLAASWGTLRAWIVDQGLTPADGIWEVYDVEPNPEMDPADLRTTLNWPIGEG